VPALIDAKRFGEVQAMFPGIVRQDGGAAYSVEHVGDMGARVAGIGGRGLQIARAAMATVASAASATTRASMRRDAGG